MQVCQMKLIAYNDYHTCMSNFTSMKYGMSGIKIEQPNGSFHNKLKVNSWYVGGWYNSMMLEYWKLLESGRVNFFSWRFYTLCKDGGSFSWHADLRNTNGKIYFLVFIVVCCSRVAGLCDQVARGQPVLAAGGHGAQGGHSGMQSFLS